MTENPNNPQPANSTTPVPFPIEIEKALSKLPNEERKMLQAFCTHQRIELSQFASPLPPPAVLEAYGRTVPTAPERILKMVEEQAQHRIKLEEKVIPQREGLATRGQWMGFFIATWGLTVAGYIARCGFGAAAAIVGGASLASIVWAFTANKARQGKELNQNRPK